MNGVVERFMRTLGDSLRANFRGVDSSVWDFCVRYIAWSWNRIPKPKLNRHPKLNGLAPKDILSSRKHHALNFKKISPFSKFCGGENSPQRFGQKETSFQQNFKNETPQIQKCAKHRFLCSNTINIPKLNTTHGGKPSYSLQRTVEKRTNPFDKDNFCNVVGKVSFEAYKNGPPGVYPERGAAFVPERETLPDIGISHPPPGSSEVFPS